MQSTQIDCYVPPSRATRMGATEPRIAGWRAWALRGESAACAEAAAPSGASAPRAAAKAAVTTASLNLFISPPSEARQDAER